MRVLITGFPPFPGRPINPTQELVRAVAQQGSLVSGCHLRTAELPVEYRAVEERFAEAVTEHDPDVVLAFGVGKPGPLLRLETQGVNWDECEVPDNAGELRCGQPIVHDGPESLRSSLDLEPLHSVLAAQGHSVALSDNAGRYVCNHLLYFGLHYAAIQRHRYRMAFVHVPQPEHGFALDAALRGLTCLLDALVTSGDDIA